MDQRILYRDVSCHYSDRGKGNVLLWVHGFCEDGSMWDGFADAYMDNYRVIVVDLPGYRNSKRTHEHLSIELFADYLRAVLDHAGVEMATVIGHSMGGYTALAFAERYPESIEKLVMFHSHPFADDDARKANREKACRFIEKNGPEYFLRELYTGMFADKHRSAYLGKIEDNVAQGMKYDPVTIVESQRAMIARPNRSDVLLNLAAPVLFIVGKLDSSIPYNQSMQQAHLPKVGMLKVLPNAGHVGMYEATEACKSIIEQFLSLDI